uniref:Tax1-binding protein 3 n=1 Tax=Lepisosteus oculatus TaxID=7918 RepID=W5M6Q1_LEPOC
MSFIPGQPVTAVVLQLLTHKLYCGLNRVCLLVIKETNRKKHPYNLFSSKQIDWMMQGIYVTRVTPGGPAEVAGLMVGDKIMQVNGWDMTMVTHDQARKRLTKKNEDIVRLLVTRKSLEEAVRHSMM